MSYLINRRIDFTRTYRYRLSIQVDLSGFSFAVIDDGASKCRQLHHHSFPDTQDQNDIYSEVVTWYNRYPQLKSLYASIHCTYRAPWFTLIPESIFAPDKAATILQSIHSINDLDEIYFYKLPKFNAVCIYSVPNSITAPILKNQTTARFYSIAVPLIQMTTPLYGHTRVLFYYWNQHLYLTLMKEQQLLLCNAYQTPEFANALYFLFFVLHQWQLNPESLRLYVSGQLSKQNLKLLHNYFPLISVLSYDSIPLSSELTLQYTPMLYPICESSADH